MPRNQLWQWWDNLRYVTSDWHWLEDGCYVTSYGIGDRRMLRNQLWHWLECGCYVTRYGSGWSTDGT